ADLARRRAPLRLCGMAVDPFLALARQEADARLALPLGRTAEADAAVAVLLDDQRLVRRAGLRAGQVDQEAVFERVDPDLPDFLQRDLLAVGGVQIDEAVARPEAAED